VRPADTADMITHFHVGYFQNVVLGAMALVTELACVG
jgi:hypothetical protein